MRSGDAQCRNGVAVGLLHPPALQFDFADLDQPKRFHRRRGDPTRHLYRVAHFAQCGIHMPQSEQTDADVAFNMDFVASISGLANERSGLDVGTTGLFVTAPRLENHTHFDPGQPTQSRAEVLGQFDRSRRHIPRQRSQCALLQQ